MGYSTSSPPLLLGITAKDLSVFFTCIAVLLGAGILSLPTKLVYTGFTPYLVLFTITFGMQVAIVLVHSDTLQHAQRHMLARLRFERGGAHVAVAPQPDLHTIAKLYLTPSAAIVFDGAVLLTFVATLISYSLAGANAFAQLLNVSVPSLIVPFVGICTFVLIFASGIVAPVIAVLTFVKVLLLAFIIGTCTVVAVYVKNPFHESWADVMNPFLVGTVAIGGISMMMSVFFTYSRPTPADIRHFRASIILGILACYVLNVVWARAVLGIVPQTREDAVAANSPVSLEAAADAGDIATKPVITIINEKYQQYNWVASTVTAFITLSITVSFNAVGLGIKHVLDGMAVTVLRAAAAPFRLPTRDVAELAESMASSGGDGHGGSSSSSDGGNGASVPSRSFLDSISPTKNLAALRTAVLTSAGRVLISTRALLYAATFGTVLGVALANPSGFITVLEVFVSMALNTGGGVLVVMMYVGVRSPPRGSRHRAALLAGGHGALAAADAAAAAAKATAAAAAAGALDEASEPLTTSSASSTAEEGAALVHGGHRAEGAASTTTMTTTTSGADDDSEAAPIALPLHEGWGAVLAVFCLVTFAIAVVYDIYSAGINKKVYDVPTGAWIAVCAGILFWRHAFVPTLKWLLRAQKQAREASRADAAPGLPRPRPRLHFVYYDDAGEEDSEEEDWDNGGGVGWFGGGGADGEAVHAGAAAPGATGKRKVSPAAAAAAAAAASASSTRNTGAARGGSRLTRLAYKALRVVSGFNFADEVVDIGAALSTAWAAVDCPSSTDSLRAMLPALLTGCIIATHLVVTPLLRRCCKPVAPALRLCVSAVALFLLVGLGVLNVLCGAVGASVVQFVLLAYAVWATWYRLARREPTDPLPSGPR